VLVVNAGSSSLKRAVIDGNRTVASTTAERWERETRRVLSQ
jgi:acetate kinase